MRWISFLQLYLYIQIAGSFRFEMRLIPIQNTNDLEGVIVRKR